MTKLFSGKKEAVYAYAPQSFAPIDLHKESKKSGSLILSNKVATGGSILELSSPDLAEQGVDGVEMDMKNWLPYAAPAYNISSDMKDYLMVPTVIMPSDLPNRNGAAFPLRELIKFHPHLGQQAYKTWKGKPTYFNHKNDVLEEARGVIADSSMRKMTEFGGGKIWKVLLFLTFDRSKHPDMCQDIMNGDLNSYSMGAWVSSYTCSYCGHEIGGRECTHLFKSNPSQMYVINQDLVFRNCVGIEGFECSAVDTPAYISAISDAVSTML
jgi:hypothetical protein